MRFRIGWVLLGLCLAACQTALPPQATPIESLPVNVVFQDQAPTAVPQAIIDAADAEYLLLTNIYERVAPSVINIQVVGGLDVGRGSGFILDTQGHIVTNAHVVEGAQNIEVTFNSGYVTMAEIVGLDAYSDLAVIRVNTDEARLLPVTLADSDTVRVGERAIAIGNPFGLASSMTLGIISGLGRQLPSAELMNAGLSSFRNPSIIQVDTDINPGNSGGPLLNSRGEVIGVNAAIRTDTGVAQGVGFAVPANTVKRVAPELIANGRVDYAWLGISTRVEDDGFSVAALAEPLNLPVEAGVLVDRVTVNSPADKAGLQGGTRSVIVRGASICSGGDIIIAVNDLYVKNMDELVGYLVVNAVPGEVVNLLVVRGSETFEIPLTLESRPSDDAGLIESGCE